MPRPSGPPSSQHSMSGTTPGRGQRMGWSLRSSSVLLIESVGAVGGRAGGGQSIERGLILLALLQQLVGRLERRPSLPVQFPPRPDLRSEQVALGAEEFVGGECPAHVVWYDASVFRLPP